MNPLKKIQTAEALHTWAKENSQPQGTNTIEIPLFNPTIPDADLRTLRQEVDELADTRNPPVTTRQNSEGQTVLVFPRKSVEYIAGVSKSSKLPAETEEDAVTKPRVRAAKPASLAPLAVSPEISGLVQDVIAAIADTKRPSVIAPGFSNFISINKEKEP